MIDAPAYKIRTSEEKQKLTEAIKKPLHDPHAFYIENPLIEEDKKDRESDRELKRIYAVRFIWILVFQLIIMNVVFIMAGFKLLSFSQWALELYMSGTLAEVFGVVFIITRHLFPTTKK